MADYSTLLRDHVTLTCRSIDRIFLQAYVRRIAATVAYAASPAEHRRRYGSHQDRRLQAVLNWRGAAMHGVIFSELRRYADDRLGPGNWRELLRDAELGPRIYLAVQTYPDEEAIALVGAASARAGLPVPAVLEDFGMFIAPTLLSMYKSLIKPGWRTLDVLENTEQTIHTVVRMRNPGAAPAVLNCRRDTSDSLVLTYTSERRLCPLAIGIIKGLAAHFGDDIDIDQTQCMYDGADACTMAVRTRAVAGAPIG